MKILHVVNRMGMGGIETFIMNMYKNVSNDVHFDFAVHTSIPGEYDDQIRKLGGEIFVFPSRRKSFVAYIRGWKRFLKENADKYDAIHMHVSSLTTIVPLVFAKKYKIKVRIIHAHSTSQNGLIHNLFCVINKKAVMKYATNLIACSTEAGKYVFGKNKFDILYNGIETAKYVYSEKKRNQIRKELNISKDVLVFGHIGRFTYAKNHTFLIRVFAEINKIIPKCKLILVGTGELEKEIKDLVVKLNLSDSVQFLGVRNDVCNLLSGFDAMIFPSNFEGLPVALIEAQASGLPIFSSNNISKEVKITSLVRFLPLDKSPNEWAKYIVDNINQYDNRDYTNEVIKCNYDISSTVSKLCKIYAGDNNEK